MIIPLIIFLTLQRRRRNANRRVVPPQANTSTLPNKYARPAAPDSMAGGLTSAQNVWLVDTGTKWGGSSILNANIAQLENGVPPLA